MQKFILPDLKPYLEEKGLDLSQVVQKARQINESSTPSMRSWSSAVNTAGVSQKILSRIKAVTPLALEQLGQSCPAMVLNDQAIVQASSSKARDK